MHLVRLLPWGMILMPGELIRSWSLSIAHRNKGDQIRITDNRALQPRPIERTHRRRPGSPLPELRFLPRLSSLWNHVPHECYFPKRRCTRQRQSRLWIRFWRFQVYSLRFLCRYLPLRYLEYASVLSHISLKTIKRGAVSGSPFFIYSIKTQARLNHSFIFLDRDLACRC